MWKRKKKNLLLIHREEVRQTGVKALIILLIGLTIAHLGVTLFLLSELGTDTFTVFIQGLSRVFGLTVGTVHVIVLCILMVIMLLTTKDM